MQTSLLNKILVKLDHWKETAHQRQSVLAGGHELAKDIGVSYATLQFELSHHGKPKDPSQKPVVTISSKKIHKLKIVH